MSKYKKVLVGMSGGVDSSIAAYLLSKDGLDVEGVFANCFYSVEECRNTQDLKDAISVASQLGIAIKVIDLRDVYHDKVLEKFYEGYRHGVTPNPDVLCNSEVKFGAMAEGALKDDPDTCLATGHYVANRHLTSAELKTWFGGVGVAGPLIDSVLASIYRGVEGGLNFLFSGADSAKDQSYFLYKLYDNYHRLPRYIFPLGGMTKAEVRRLADSLALNVANKPDSQGICFVGDVKLREFIKNHVKGSVGDVINLKGEVIGSHSGVQYYTIGQRHGFHVNTYAGVPLYIVEKKVDKNVLVVAERGEAYFEKFIISDLSFPYDIEKFLEDFNKVGLSVRVRNLGKKIRCQVLKLENEKFEVRLLEPEFGVAPGQSAVFYVDRLMLGGGIIESATRISKN